jgi:hypothetical protein
LRLRAYARGSDFLTIVGNNISISKCLKPRQIFAIGVKINGKWVRQCTALNDDATARATLTLAAELEQEACDLEQEE